MYINVSLVKSYAPSNVNRDDTGSPKTAIFGGSNRGRVSSQCIKRSVRTSEVFQEYFDQNFLGLRTKNFPKLLLDELVSLGISETESMELASVIPSLLVKPKNDKTKKDESDKKEKGETKEENPLETKQLIFITRQHAKNMAISLNNIVQEIGVRKLIDTLKSTSKDTSKDKKQIIKRVADESIAPSPDIALFGSMTTSDLFKNVEAASSFAHSISTHVVEEDFDYFTAMDDFSEEPGAGHLADRSFNSATAYQWIGLSVDQLFKNLQDDEMAIKTIESFIKSLVLSNPSGMQHGFASPTLPDFCLVEITGANQALSCVNAFETPIKSRSNGYIKASVDTLIEYSQNLRETYDIPSDKTLVLSTFDIDGKCKNLSELISGVIDYVAKNR